MKKIIIAILLVFLSFPVCAQLEGLDIRRFSFTLKKPLSKPFEVIFVDKHSDLSSLYRIQEPVINLSSSPELAYYMVFAVKEQKAHYSINITILPFMKDEIILPANVYISNDNSSMRSVSSELPSTGLNYTISGDYGPEKVTGQPEYYFFGFYYSFPETVELAPGKYMSAVTVEVNVES